MAAASLATRWADFDFLLEIKGPFLSEVQEPNLTNAFSACEALGTEALTREPQRQLPSAQHAY